MKALTRLIGGRCFPGDRGVGISATNQEGFAPALEEIPESPDQWSIFPGQAAGRQIAGGIKLCAPRRLIHQGAGFLKHRLLVDALAPCGLPTEHPF